MLAEYEVSQKRVIRGQTKKVVRDRSKNHDVLAKLCLRKPA